MSERRDEASVSHAHPADARRRRTARPAPLLFPAIGFLAGIVVSEYAAIAIPTLLVRAVVIVAAVAACFLLIARRKGGGVPHRPIVLVLALLAGVARHQIAVDLPANHVGRIVNTEGALTRIVGTVITAPLSRPALKRNPFLPYEPTPRTRFLLEAREARSGEQTALSGYVRVTVATDALDVQPGDRVLVTGRLYRPRGPRNPGEYDWARWNRLQNVCAAMFVEDTVHVKRLAAGESWWRSAMTKLRAHTQGMLFAPFERTDDEAVQVLDAMVLGHRSAPTTALNEAFLRTGSIHFLTVSGFHIGLLGLAVWYCVRRVLRRGYRTAAVATIAVLLLYALIAEPNAPILRATTMGVLICVAQLAGRPFSALNWLALAAIVILAVHPLELFRPGFQLSFVQVLALMTIVPAAYRWLLMRSGDDWDPAARDADTWLGLVGRRVLGLAVVCGVAWLTALPLVLFHFERFAPWAPLQSLLITPIVVVCVVLGFVTLMVGTLVAPLGAALAVLLHFVSNALLAVVHALASWPGTLVETGAWPLWPVLATYALAIVWWRTWQSAEIDSELRPVELPAAPGIRRWKRLVCVALLTAIPAPWLWQWAASQVRAGSGFEVHVLSVGSGSAVLLATEEREGLLIDVGTISNFDVGQTAVRAARALGVRRLRAIMISHANSDHYSGVPSVLAGMPVDRVYSNAYLRAAAEEKAAVRELLATIRASTAETVALTADEQFNLGGVRIEVLWPPGGLDPAYEVNDRSLVVRAVYGETRVLIPGDIERAAIRTLVAQHRAGEVDLAADVLIAPHHGSVLPGDTAEFYELVAPQVVINSTGKPRPKLNALLAETFGDRVTLFSTDKAGAIVVKIDAEGGLRIETPFAER